MEQDKPLDLEAELDCIRSAIEETKPQGHQMFCPMATFAQPKVCKCFFEEGMELYEKAKAALEKIKSQAAAVRELVEAATEVEQKWLEYLGDVASLSRLERSTKRLCAARAALSHLAAQGE
jgi:hypothetical protein